MSRRPRVNPCQGHVVFKRMKLRWSVFGLGLFAVSGCGGGGSWPEIDPPTGGEELVVFRPEPPGGTTGRAAYAADRNGAGREPLNVPVETRQPTGGNTYMQLSRDGTITTVLDGAEDGTTQVFRVESDVRIKSQISSGPNVDGYAISADGRTIAVLNIGLGRIDVIRLSDLNRRTVVSSNALRIGSFSGGSRLSFVARGVNDVGTRLGIVDIETGNVVFFGASGGTAQDVAISPNGAQLVYSAGGDLYLQSASGGLPVRITTTPQFERFPSFSRDNQTLVFSRDPGTTNAGLYLRVAGTGTIDPISAQQGEDHEAYFVDNIPEALKIVPE